MFLLIREREEVRGRNIDEGEHWSGASCRILSGDQACCSGIHPAWNWTSDLPVLITEEHQVGHSFLKKDQKQVRWVDRENPEASCVLDQVLTISQCAQISTVRRVLTVWSKEGPEHSSKNGVGG